MSDTPLPTSDKSDGRDPGGRFALGNPGGPGNPFNRRVAHLRRLCLAAVPEDKLEALIAVILDKGLTGDMAAAKLILQYTLGKPTAAVEPDRIEIDELRLRYESAAPMTEWAPPLEHLPARIVNKISESMWPALRDPVVKGLQNICRDQPPEKRRKGRKARKRARMERAANGVNGAPCPTTTKPATIRLIDPDDHGQAG